MIPALFAQDAAGAGEVNGGSPTGGFALAVAFPPLQNINWSTAPAEQVSNFSGGVDN